MSPFSRRTSIPAVALAPSIIKGTASMLVQRLQPVFIQVPIGLAIFLVGGYLLAWFLGILFLTFLRISEKREKGE